MQHSLIAIGMASLVLFGTQTIAQDSTEKSKDAVSQRMKACMDRQKATNSGMTQLAMETTCRNEAKGNGEKDGNNLASGPKAKTPDGTKDENPPQ